MLVSVNDIVGFLHQHKYEVTVLPTEDGCVVNLPNHPLISCNQIYYRAKYVPAVKAWALTSHLKSEEIPLGVAPEYVLSILVFMSIINICDIIGFDSNLVRFCSKENVDCAEDEYLQILHKPSKALVLKKTNTLLEILQSNDFKTDSETAKVLAEEANVLAGYETIRDFQRGAVVQSFIQGESNEPV